MKTGPERAGLDESAAVDPEVDACHVGASDEVAAWACDHARQFADKPPRYLDAASERAFREWLVDGDTAPGGTHDQHR